MSDTAHILKEGLSPKDCPPSHPRFENSLLGLCFFLVMLISAGGWFYYQYQATQARKAARESLATIADLKAEEISNWLKERQGDAEVVRTSLVAKGVMANPASPEAREAAVMRAEIFRKIYGYAAVVFADAQGRVQLKVPADYPLSDASLHKHVQAALHSQTAQIADLNRDTTNGPILMWLECPIFTDFQTNGPRAGAVILVVDPHTFLYPTIDKWPAPSQTAETVIARREGDEVVRLNNRRFGTNSALNVRASITANPQRPMVLAAQSIQGVTEGVDYRGKSVFMATRKITGMPWFMVAMIDQEEVLAPLHNEAWNVGIITALLLLASMLGIGLLWRQQKLADGRTNETRLQMLIEQAPLAINISREGKTVYANQKFLNFYGYKSFEELVGRPIFIYWAPEFRELIKERVRKRAQGGPVPSEYNGMAQRKDGSQFPVEIAVASVELPDGRADLAFIADITERQRAEQSLKLFRALIDHANDSIEVIDPDTGRFLDVNERGLQLHGYSREEYLALTVPQIDPRFDPATDKKVWQAHSENLKRIGFAVFETEHRRKDGSVFPVEVNANYVRLERDYILAVVRDITERKQAEKALLETKEQLQYIVNNTRDVIFQIDLNGNYIYGNSAAEQLTGYPLPQLLKMNMMQLVAPEYHALVKERLQQRLAGKVGEAAFKFEILHKDGHRIWTEQTTSEVRDSENKLVAIQGVARNITEQKKAEAALQFSEEKFSKAFQLSPDAMSISDLETGKYIEINDAHAKIFGYSKAEIIGHTACELKIVPGTIHDQTTETLRGQNSLHGLAIRLHNRKGESLEVMHSAEIIELGGRKCVLRVSRDVTKQRKLEEQFRQSQKMEAIGQLAGGVAHDFNNILAVIQMQSGLLRASENLSREQSELTDEIGHASQRAAALTRQLLLFSRKETAQKRDLDLNTAVNSMTKMLRRVISAEVQVQFKFAMEALFVHADPGMLDQVLMNLVVNARDAMPGGGKIVIETSSVEIDELSLANSQQAQTGSFVCLGVSDTGTGIPPEMLPKIFEPFFTTKKVGMGTGLGLATVFGIVQQHQGWVNVYSEIGQGSTFRVYLPRIVKTAEPQAEHPAFNTARGGKETILVVEDNAALSAAVCKTLWHLGYQVLAAASGPEALLIWKDKRDGIDLLLTDLVMPGGMNGKELAVQLLKEKPELKVIYASGYSAEVAGNDFPLEEGVNFLSKPFPALKLATTIRNILDKKTFLG